MSEQGVDSSKGANANGSTLKWENSPQYLPENNQRARKETVSIPAKTLKTYLDVGDREDIDSAAAKGWLSLGGGSVADNKLIHKPSHTSSAPLSQCAPGLQNSKLGPEICDASLSALVGFLVSYDTVSAGEAYALRVGRWIVSSVPLGLPGSTMVIQDKSVSAVHATISVSEQGEVRILDHFSEGGSALIRQGKAEAEKISESVVSLSHGDQVRFGERIFRLCMIPK